MHITTMFESQAIALLHEVCDALGIEPENRTREEIRRRLKSLDSNEPQFSAAYSETGPGWSDDEEVCKCPCHNSGSVMMHVSPCCGPGSSSGRTPPRTFDESFKAICNAGGCNTVDNIEKEIAELRGKPTAEETLHLLMGAMLIELISNTDNITSASRYIDYDGETFHVSVRRGKRGDTEKDFE